MTGQQTSACVRECAARLVQVAARAGAEVVASTELLEPVVPGFYEPADFRCPHGFRFWVSATGEQIRRWEEQGMEQLTYRNGRPPQTGDLVAAVGISDYVFELRQVRFEGAAVVMNTAPGFGRTSTLPLANLEPLDDADLECWCTDAERDRAIVSVRCPRHGDRPDHDLATNPARSAALRYAIDRKNLVDSGADGRHPLVSGLTPKMRGALGYLAGMSWGAHPERAGTWRRLEKNDLVRWTGQPGERALLLTAHGRRVAARLDLELRLQLGDHAKSGAGRG